MMEALAEFMFYLWGAAMCGSLSVFVICAAIRYARSTWERW